MQAIQKSVHQGAPCPEAVARIGATGLRQTRHSTLKCVTVQIDRGRQKQIDGRDAGLHLIMNAADSPLINLNAKVAGPAIDPKPFARIDFLHCRTPLTKKVGT